MFLIPLLGSLGGLEAAHACTKPSRPEDPPRAWVLVRGNDVTIMVRPYTTFQATGAVCACGMKNIPSIGQTTGLSVRTMDTQQSLFSFSTNGNTSTGFAGVAGGQWAGFSSAATPQPIGAGQQVELVFTGKLAAGASFQTVMSDLLASGNFGTDQGTSTGALSGVHTHITPPPRLVDPALAGPVGKLNEMHLEARSSIGVRIQDPDDGLAEIRMIGASNMVETVSSFAPGTREPVEVIVERSDDRLPSSATIEACNLRGECNVFEPRLQRVLLGEAGRAEVIWSRLTSRLGLIRIRNLEEGFARASVFSNGSRFSLRPLERGQAVDLDLLLEPDGNRSSTVRTEFSGPALDEAEIGFLGLP